jgi:hypothetical protein
MDKDKRESDLKKIAHYMDCLEYHLNAISDYADTLRGLGIDIDTADVCFRVGLNESKRPIWRFHVKKGLPDIAEATSEKIMTPAATDEMPVQKSFMVFKHLWMWSIGYELEAEDEDTESEETGSGKAADGKNP